MADVGIGAPGFDVLCGFDQLFDTDAPEDSGPWVSKLPEMFSPEGLSLIGRAQDTFDYDSDGEGSPGLWKNALEELEAIYNEEFVDGL